MQDWSSRKHLLSFLIVFFLIVLVFPDAFCIESDYIDWQMSSLDVFVYALNVERKEINLQWYFSFSANSSFETRVFYIPTTGATYLYPGESLNGNWYHCIIDRRRTDLEVSSPDDYLYPFDRYIIKILVGFNVTLEVEKLIEELSKAEFKIEKDDEKSVEIYWNISNKTKVLNTIPEEYTKLLKSADKTVFQIQITMTRKFHQSIIPFFLYWVVPIISVIFSFAMFLLVKREEFSTLRAMSGGLPAPFLVMLLVYIQNQKPPCFTVAEMIIMVTSFWVSISPFLAILLRKKKESREIVVIPTKSKFNVNRFSSDLENFKNLSDEDTRDKLLERIRSQLTDLPLGGMPSNIRNTIIEFLPILKDEIKNETRRLLCLRCVSTIYNRGDGIVNARIKTVFSSEIENIYGNLTLEEKRKALTLRQRFRDHDFEFMKKMVTDAIELEKNEFDALYLSIEFDRLTKKQISTLRKTLWKWRSEANQRKEKQKVARIDKFLDLDIFQRVI